jgi:hypothetical protein
VEGGEELDTDTLTEALLEEAEAIVRAEWLRLHDLQPRGHGLSRRCTELPDIRHRQPHAIVTTVAVGPRGLRHGCASGEQPARRSLPLRVSPTQRSPPASKSAVPKRVVQGVR